MNTLMFTLSAGILLAGLVDATAQVRPRVATNSQPAPLPSPVTRVPRQVMRFNQMVEELNLTEEQKLKFQAAMAEQAKALREFLAETSLSQEERTAKTRALAEKSRTAVNAILNDEQRKKYTEMMARSGGRPAEPAKKEPAP